MHHSLIRILPLLAVALLAVGKSPTRAALQSTRIIVNSTDDDDTVNGNCTLREAIAAANSLLPVDGCAAGGAGPSLIEFALGAGTPSITVASALPVIERPMVIDGRTGGARRVELRTDALNLFGLVVTGGGTTIRALVVNNFKAGFVPGTFAGLVLLNGDGNVVQDCFIGTDATGTVARGNEIGIRILSSADNLIGGTTPEARNIISGNVFHAVLLENRSAVHNRIAGNYLGLSATGAALGNGSGIEIANAPANFIGGNVISGNRDAAIQIAFFQAQENRIVGNYIGTTTDGMGALGNGGGILLFSRFNLVGGTTPADRNVISANQGNGITLFDVAEGNSIAGNYIGTAADGVTPLGNRDSGISVGVTVPVARATAVTNNRIAYNGGDGVTVFTGTGTLITDNAVFDNGKLGIASSAGPHLTAAAAATNDGATVGGTFIGARNARFTLQFFANQNCDPSGFGEGQTVIGQSAIFTDPLGQADFNVTLPNAPLCRFITVTATEQATDNTSAFSNCAPVYPLGAPTPALTIGDASVVEGNSGVTHAVFTVTLSNAAILCAPVSVKFATATLFDSPARALFGEDLKFTAGELRFQPGETSKTIAVEINGDTIFEADEIFAVRITDAQPGVTIADAQGLGVIVNDDAAPPTPVSQIFNAPGPDLPASSGVAFGEQRTGSVLFFPLYTSSVANPNAQNTRLNLTNGDARRAVSVHLFFVDGASCAVADAYICLTPNQTVSLLASDLDPGTTGYVIAVATNATGCPTAFNALFGDEYVKLATGHAANLGAQAAATADGFTPFCSANAATATLFFNGFQYSRLPRVVALSHLLSRADGNDTLLVLNRIGGDLRIGAQTLNPIAGLLYNDAETSYSFALIADRCQFVASLTNNFPRTTPRFEQVVPAGRSGWLKLWQPTDAALIGAALNFNANAFKQGHSLHTLTHGPAAALTIPLIPPRC